MKTVLICIIESMYNEINVQVHHKQVWPFLGTLQNSLTHDQLKKKTPIISLNNKNLFSPY